MAPSPFLVTSHHGLGRKAKGRRGCGARHLHDYRREEQRAEVDIHQYVSVVLGTFGLQEATMKEVQAMAPH
ncbi:unnamed protein product [Urochloa humidicola]